jgi:murein DD-endopeptidase MepM/ murein hydrolase activator NlpD
MRFITPIKNIGLQPPNYGGWETFISQKFGVKWISQIDQKINGIQIYKGDDVYLKVFGMIGHNGVDIAAPRYTPVYAPHSGFIVQADSGEGYGNRVMLMHTEGDTQYLHVFGHLDNWKPLPRIPWNLKYTGKYVAQGEKIGEVDSTGFSNGHHLHWGLYIYKNYVKQNTNNGYQGAIDPWQFVKENYMEIFQIEGEKTLVIKNLDGKFYYLATNPELYPYVAQILGLKDKNFSIVRKAEVEANIGGDAKAGLTFIAK